MKRKFITFICVMLLLSLCGCAKEECDFCGEMKRCKQYENAFFGEVTLCNDCVDDMNSAFDY